MQIKLNMALVVPCRGLNFYVSRQRNCGMRQKFGHSWFNKTVLGFCSCARMYRIGMKNIKMVGQNTRCQNKAFSPLMIPPQHFLQPSNILRDRFELLSFSLEAFGGSG